MLKIVADDPLLQERGDLGDNLDITRRLLHRLGPPEHVHQDDQTAPPRRQLEHGRIIVAPGGDVVDDRRPGVERGGGDFNPRRIDAEEHPGPQT